MPISKKKLNLYKILVPLIEGNNSAYIAKALDGYDGKLGGLEQELGCLAVNVFRKGRDPLALFALSKAGFNLLGRNSDDRCPFEDMVHFHNFAQSRKNEAASALRAVLKEQYERFLPRIREDDPGYANWIDIVKKSVEPKKPRRRGPNLARLLYPALWALMATSVGMSA